NLDLVASQRSPAPADLLLLERFAEKTGDNVWRLDRGKSLTALEEGLTIRELRDYLHARCVEELPQTVEVFLDDLEQKGGQLTDRGLGRRVECADSVVARRLA